jgi:hypothetical protein
MVTTFVQRRHKLVFYTLVVCHAQLVAVMIRVIWLASTIVSVSVEVVLPSLVQEAGEAG